MKTPDRSLQLDHAAAFHASRKHYEDDQLVLDFPASLLLVHELVIISCVLKMPSNLGLSGSCSYSFIAATGTVKLGPAS